MNTLDINDRVRYRKTAKTRLGQVIPKGTFGTVKSLTPRGLTSRHCLMW